MCRFVSSGWVEDSKTSFRNDSSTSQGPSHRVDSSVSAEYGVPAAGKRDTDGHNCQVHYPVVTAVRASYMAIILTVRMMHAPFDGGAHVVFVVFEIVPAPLAFLPLCSWS